MKANWFSEDGAQFPKREALDFDALFRASAQSLQTAIDAQGSATTDISAWGYAPVDSVTRCDDGKLQVRTYHFEGETRSEKFETCQEVIEYLYSDGEGTWEPGEWIPS